MIQARSEKHRRFTFFPKEYSTTPNIFFTREINAVRMGMSTGRKANACVHGVKNDKIDKIL